LRFLKSPGLFEKNRVFLNPVYHLQFHAQDVLRERYMQTVGSDRGCENNNYYSAQQGTGL